MGAKDAWDAPTDMDKGTCITDGCDCTHYCFFNRTKDYRYKCSGCGAIIDCEEVTRLHNKITSLHACFFSGDSRDQALRCHTCEICGANVTDREVRKLYDMIHPWKKRDEERTVGHRTSHVCTTFEKDSPCRCFECVECGARFDDRALTRLAVICGPADDEVKKQMMAQIKEESLKVDQRMMENSDGT